jgi:hypothetical protein
MVGIEIWPGSATQAWSDLRAQGVCNVVVASDGTEGYRLAHHMPVLGQRREPRVGFCSLARLAGSASTRRVMVSGEGPLAPRVVGTRSLSKGIVAV